MAHHLDANTNLYQIKAQINKYHYNDGMEYKEIFDRLYYYFIMLKKEYKSIYGIGLVPYITVPKLILETMGTEEFNALLAQLREEDAADDAFIEELLKKNKEIC